MNVSISQVVADLHTTVSGVQLAITAYTLVMAAFMLTGAKLGDIWGRRRAFSIGLAIYGVGSLTTALSPNLDVLLIGWSGIEGLGAVLVIPAIASLTAANYSGRERALAYGLLGGIAGAGAAAGPLIGGFITTDAQLAGGVRRGDRDRARAAHVGAPHRRPADGRAGQARPRRGGAVGARARSHGVLDPQDQHVGPVQTDRGADDRRHADHPVRLLGRPLPDPRRPRCPRPLRPLGAARGRRRAHAAAGARPAAHPAAARRPLDARLAVPDPRRHLLRAAALPAAGARQERPGNRREDPADLGDDDARRGARPAPGDAHLAPQGRADRARLPVRLDRAA